MGGGGGPLAFLNKKTWHTGSLRVMEEVWKREQEHEKEQRHLEELKKQLDEERQIEELEKTATDAGHTKCEVSPALLSMEQIKETLKTSDCFGHKIILFRYKRQSFAHDIGLEIYAHY